MNDELAQALQLLMSDPMQAADSFDELAARLQKASAELRAKFGTDYKSPGGMGDRVRVQVFGPDGRIKQDASTN